MAALNDLSFYTNRSLGGVGAEEINSPQAQALLAELRKYDPAATFKPTQLGDQTGYTLSFDPSKVPGYDPNAITITGEGFNGRPMSWSDQLKDPSAVTTSGLFGEQTNRSNIKPQAPTWLDYVGPAAVGLFGFGMAGIPGTSFGGFGSQFSTLGADSAAAAGSAGGFVDPWDVMGDPTAYGLSGAAPITDLGSPARVGDVIRNGGIPGIDNIVQSASEISPTSLLRNGSKAVAGLLGGTPAGAGSGAGGLLGGGGGGGGTGSPYEDSMAILARYYGIPQDMLRKVMKGQHA